LVLIATPNPAVLAGVFLTSLGVLYLGIMPGPVLDLAGFSFSSLF
jgi:hypothetical protein